MSVRKRKWTNSAGIEKEAWVVDYVDGGGARRLKTFQRKKEADAYASEADVGVRRGTHVADSVSETVAQAGDAWLVKRGEIRVTQRADRFNKIGSPKSAASVRTVPIGPVVVNTLREWKLACPKGKLGLVFPNGSGKVESLANIINRALVPVQLKAGVSIAKVDGDGKPALDDEERPIRLAKYTGMHALRHFYASWCINRREDGGRGMLPKEVQERLGHASITVTMDIYGHLFPRGDDVAELAAAERALFG